MFKVKKPPKLPGVYWFLDKHQQVIYVGKAKNLTNRLKSYALINQTSTKTKTMLAEAVKVKFKTVGSEFEALLVEAELIKAYQPKYNILLKDDKSKIYLTITQEEYPRLLMARKTGDYGPFPSSKKLQDALKVLRRIFPYCNQKIKGRACFYYHLNLCPGACVGLITPEKYQIQIRHLRILLSGKIKSLIIQLRRELKKAASIQDYETAGIFRDQINALNQLQKLPSLPETALPQLTEDLNETKLIGLARLLKRFFPIPANYPLNRIEAYDISNLQGTNPTGSMVVFIDAQPRPDLYRHFKIKSLNTPNDLKMHAEVMKRRVKHLDWGIPDLIVIDGAKNQLKAILAVIPWDIPVIGLAKNPDRLITLNFPAFTLNSEPASLLLQFLRNESHRFALRLHHHLRLQPFH